MAVPDRAPRLPDFIIGGAMKSGTTSIHHLLGSHPGVFIPDPELFFFDSDDVVQHPQLLRRGFVVPDYRKELGVRLDHYRAWFEGAGEGQLVGEDTTTYLPSDKAPDRLADLLPDVKLVFVLRDPVDRAYSHYWHLVRNGLAFFDFDTTLEHMAGTILQRGLYRAQLERFFSRFSREQVHVVIFEEFRASTQRVLDGLCAFLGLSPAVLMADAGGSRYNAGAATRHPRLLRGVSLLRASFSPSWAAQTPLAPAAAVRKGGLGLNWAKSVLFDDKSPYPPLPADTRERLGRFYARENAGLAELLDRDPATLWACPAT